MQCRTPCFARDQPLIEGTFISRPNRFLAVVRLGSGLGSGEMDGPEVEAHVADPGRLTELLMPGRRVYLAHISAGPANPVPGHLRPGGHLAGARTRKTAYDLVLADTGGTLVSLDSRVPNEVMHEALRARFFNELAGYSKIIHEASYGKSRLDFRLSGPGLRDCFVEVKSVTLVRDGGALFPDAPTARGARHLRELARAVAEGFRALVVFVVQREDAQHFSPNDETDPELGRVLRDAVRSGVETWAYICQVSLSCVQLKRRIPVLL